jgi:AraC-like DNA-binding protein
MEEIFDHLKGATRDPHRHDFFTIVWVKKANGYHLIDFNKYTLSANQVYFVGPGRIHQIHTPTRPNGAVITFSNEFLIQANISEKFVDNIRLFSQYNQSPPLELDVSTSFKLEHIVNNMLECRHVNSPFNDHALGALLKLFLIYCNSLCYREREYHKDEQISDVIWKFKDLVEKNFRERHKVKEYADLMHITPKYLNEVVKNSIGYTAKEYIQDRISTEARRLLIHTRASVKEIGYDLGFKEPIHFSAFFKNCSGFSPSEFRNNQL